MNKHNAYSQLLRDICLLDYIEQLIGLLSFFFDKKIIGFHVDVLEWNFVMKKGERCTDSVLTMEKHKFQKIRTASEDY